MATDTNVYIKGLPLSHAGLFRKLDARVLGFLVVCYALAYVDRINIGFAKLQMQRDLALSDAVYGLGAGIFFLGYVLFEIPSNLLLVRIGARKTLARIMMLWGLASASMCFVSSTTSFYALRFLLGVFEAGFAPGMIFYLSYWYPKERMARAVALVLAAAPIGGIVAGPLSGWVMTSLSGTHGLAGWQWLFILEGVPAALLGIVALFWLKDSPDAAPWLSAQERASLKGLAAPAIPERSAYRSLPAVLCNASIYRLAAAYFCLICGLYAIGFWLPAILKATGLQSVLQIGLYSAVPYIAAAVSMYALARSSDRNKERHRHAAVAAAVSAATLAVATIYLKQFGIAFVAITIATGAMFAAYSVFWAIPHDMLSGPTAAGGIAFINTLGLFGGFLSPTMIGWVKTLTGHTETGLFVIAGLLVLGALLLYTPVKPLVGAKLL
ncbi:MFS transporter [Trinickia sp. NRRL B-1857]|uniref:MFS transporter n=1 Tax=Trinickia sp. NRRL B-1857 TaxID=3162879 RepID=UPI003D2E0EDF